MIQHVAGSYILWIQESSTASLAIRGSSFCVHGTFGIRGGKAYVLGLLCIDAKAGTLAVDAEMEVVLIGQCIRVHRDFF